MMFQSEAADPMTGGFGRGNYPRNPYWRIPGQHRSAGPYDRNQGQQNRASNAVVKRQKSNSEWSNPYADCAASHDQSYRSNRSSANFTERVYHVADNGDDSQSVAQFFCDLCDVTCTTEKIYNSHLGGSKHRKKVKRKELEEKWQAKDPSTYCSICNLALDPSLMELHRNGAKHKAMEEHQGQMGNEPGSQNLQEAEAPIKETEANNAAANMVVEIKCELCMIMLRSLAAVSKHFNSRAHMLKCVERFNEEKEAAVSNPFYCHVCEISLNGQAPFDAHIQGYKHNYKLTNGNFDPDSPFGQKAMKIKAKNEKYKEMMEAYAMQT